MSCNKVSVIMLMDVSGRCYFAKALILLPNNYQIVCIYLQMLIVTLFMYFYYLIAFICNSVNGIPASKLLPCVGIQCRISPN